MLLLNLWLFTAYVLPFQRNQAHEMHWLTGEPATMPLPDDFDMGAVAR
jgi:hypothetical protein